MKKKLKIDFLSTCMETEQLALMITANNEGINPISIEDIASYLWVRRYLSYIKNADLHGTFPEDDRTKLAVWQSGKIVATIEEIELTQLNEDDLNGVLFTSNDSETGF